MRPLFLRVLVLFCVAAWSGRAHADDQTTRRARATTAAGAQFLKARKFNEAIQMFQDAQRLVPTAQIYFELGECYRGLFSEQQNPAHARAAIENYKQFLKQADPRPADSTRLRAQAEREVLSLQTQLVRLPAESTPPEAPPPPPTEILVTTQPDAQVFLDGESQGEPTPFSRVVEPGLHHVRVKTPGFESEERELQAVKGHMVLTSIDLRATPGRLTVDTNVGDGLVTLDGAVVGHAPLRRSDFASGDHQIGIVQRGYELWLDQVTIEPGKTTRLTAQLQPTWKHKIAVYSALTGGAGLLAGAVLGAMALAANSSLGQPGGDDASHKSYNDRLSTRNHLATASTIVLSTAVGVLAAAAGLHWFDVPDAPPVPSSSSEVKP